MNRRKAVAALAGIFGALSLRSSAQEYVDLKPEEGERHRHEWEQTWLLALGSLRDPGIIESPSTIVPASSASLYSPPQPYHPEPGIIRRCSICGVLSIAGDSK